MHSVIHTSSYEITNYLGQVLHSDIRQCFVFKEQVSIEYLVVFQLTDRKCKNVIFIF